MSGDVQTLTRAEINGLLDVLQSPEEGLEQRELLDLLLRCDQAFETLEQNFKADPTSMKEYVDVLRSLRSRNDARRMRLTAALADEYERLRSAAAQVAERSEAVRAAMIRVCTLTGMAELHGARADVQIRARSGREVPKPGDPLRDLLETTLRRLEVWDRVAVVSAPRLVKFLNESRDPRHLELRAMCPERRSWEVRVRGRDAGK